MEENKTAVDTEATGITEETAGTAEAKGKTVSVIILNWNGVQHGFIRKYLPTLVQYTDPNVADIVVADNGSEDSSLQVLADEFPSVKVLPLGDNYGFAEGYNRAIKQVQTPLVLLLNDDVAVTPNWLTPLLDHLAEHKHTAAVQPKILSDRDHTMFEYAGACGGYVDKNGYPYCRGRIFNTVEKDEGQYDMKRPIMWASGACMLVRRELYLKAGGLDKHFFAHMEEIDLCWRLRRMGWRITCVPHSVVYHLGGGSLPQGDPLKAKLNFRNSLLTLWKNVSKKKRRWIIFRRKCLDFLAAMNFLFHGQFDMVKAIREAHKEAKWMIEDIYEKDEAIFGHSHNGLYKHVHQTEEGRVNIVTTYYLKGLKKFSDIF